MKYKYNYKKFTKNSPLIIFVHGAGCDYSFWALLNRFFFFRGFSTLAISLPGHGDNFEKGLNSIDDMALYISKIIKKYSSKKNILIGHSMGGLICISSVVNKLFDIHKVILIGVSYPMKVSESLITMSKRNREDAIINMINWSLPSETKLRGSQLIGFSLPNFVYTLMKKTSEDNLYRDLRACNNYFISDNNINNFDIPCLIICGKKDIMTPIKGSSNLTKYFINSTFDIIENCGHFHVYEKSNEVRGLLKKYIET